MSAGAGSKASSAPLECWAFIVSYLEPKDLSISREVSKIWRELSDTSTSWIIHCSKLWNGKQNLYLERWVDTTRTSELISFNDTVNNQAIKEQAFALNQFYVKSSDLFDASRSSSDPAELERIRLYLNRINDAIDRLLDFERLNAHMAEDPCYQVQRRRFMPASQYFLSKRIVIEQQLFLSYPSLSSEEISNRFRQQILQSLQSEIVISDSDMRSLDERGVLLSWRESYYASIVDSKRTWITHEVNLQHPPQVLTHLLGITSPRELADSIS